MRTMRGAIVVGIGHDGRQAIVEVFNGILAIEGARYAVEDRCDRSDRWPTEVAVRVPRRWQKRVVDADGWVRWEIEIPGRSGLIMIG